MKVFQINSVCGTGSTGHIACDIKNMLEANQNECQIAYGRGFYDDPNCIKIESDLVFKAHVFFSRITDRQGFHSTPATKRLVHSIEHFNPDIIHLHNLHGYYLDIRVLFEFLKEYNKPVIWTLHDCWAFTGHCAHFIFAGCDKWEQGCHNCVQKKKYPSSVLLDRSAINYSNKKDLFTAVNNLTVVAPSNWLAGLVKRSFLSKFPTKVINNGIDLNAFKPTPSDFKAKNGIIGKHIVLGVAGAWNESKGFYDFIKLSEFLNENYKIVMVGLTEKQKSLLPKNILGICKTESIKELAEIYTAADVFVNPTYEDTFPTTNIEALACGTPVITYNAGGSAEMLDEKCGIIVDTGDINAVVSAIYEINLKSEDCQNKALNFEKNKQYNLYMQLYENILNSGC